MISTMLAIDKLKSDLDDWSRRSGGTPGNREFEALRLAFSRSVPGLPSETLSALFATFLSTYGKDGADKASTWLAGVGSLFLCDYDDTPFTKAEWEEIREIATVDSGEMDIEVLSYVLGKALEHGAL